MPVSPSRRTWVSGGLLLILLCLQAKWYADYSFARQLHSQLNETLPLQLQHMMPGWDREAVSWSYLASEIDADFEELPLVSPGPLASCAARVIRLQGQQIAQPAGGAKLIELQWQDEDERRSIALALQCEPNWGYLVGTQSLLLLVLAALLATIPRPLSPQRRHCLNLLRQHGASMWNAWQWTIAIEEFNDCQAKALDSLLQHVSQLDLPGLRDAINWLASGKGAELTAEQLPWFELGLRQGGGGLEQAAAIGSAPSELVFLPRESQVRIHGLLIKLPTTPFLYYLWYAMRRLRDGAQEEGGWFINPPSTGADHEHAGELVNLMEANQGNSKATRELREKGLRSKILDQNRSKVKDHLSGLLGEVLAAEFLFELERDPRTARFRYRLALPAARIRIESRLAATAPGAGEIP